MALHAPDGFLTPAAAAATAIISLVLVGVALRQSREQLGDKQVPLAGISAAFILAAQMINFPVATGTTGHLLGGALAAILLGPATGVLVVTVVVVVQALLFADGGISALGYNVLNMAVVTALGGYALFLVFRRCMPKNRGGIVGAAGLAAGFSVVMSAAMFSLEWLFGASAPVAFDDVFGAMVGVHTLIGIGEGVITALTLTAVLSTRPDLVYGVADLDRSTFAQPTPVSARAFLIAAAAVVLLMAAVVAQFAAEGPDGLEAVAADKGFADQASGHLLESSLFAGYATRGVGSQSLSLAIAGVSGTVIALTVTYGLITTSGRRKQQKPGLSEVS